MFCVNKKELLQELKFQLSKNGDLNKLLIKNKKDNAIIINVFERDDIAIYGNDGKPLIYKNYGLLLEHVSADEIFELLKEYKVKRLSIYGNAIYVNGSKEKPTSIEYLESLKNNDFIGKLLFTKLFFNDEFYYLEISINNNEIILIEKGEGGYVSLKTYPVFETINTDKLISSVKDILKVECTYNKGTIIFHKYTL